MTRFFLRIYDYLVSHKAMRVALPAFVVAVLVVEALSLTYKEDISDFLPLDKNYRQSMDIYSNLNAADKIFAIVQLRDTSAVDPDCVREAVDAYCSEVQQIDKEGIAKNLTSQVDYNRIGEVTEFVYSNIPYFLTDADYQRLDSIMATIDINERLESDKQMLMLPTGDVLSENIGRDPLHLFTPTVERLQNFRADVNYELFDGYIFSPDYKKAIVTVTSPFGSNESAANGRLIDLLDKAADRTQAHFSDIRIYTIGAPVIAVGNARQIKTDSILAVTLAAVLIVGLLVYAFRRARPLALIVVAIGFGWLFAVGLMGMLHDRISIIVIGIGSVIIGIAVNYPLHFVAHLKHYPDVRATLRELISPLLIGNITTVGAFLALVPLNSVALRDLGLFSSFMLVGTILFVLIMMPHLAGKRKKTVAESKLTFGRLSNARFENRRWVMPVILVGTLVFGWFSLDTSFDSNMQHINYMTDRQRSDFSDLQQMTGRDEGTTTIYVATTARTWDVALKESERSQARLDSVCAEKGVRSRRSVSQFLPSKTEQEHRLTLWKAFCERHKDKLTHDVHAAASRLGFSDDAFSAYDAVITGSYESKGFDAFKPLSDNLFGGFLSQNGKDCSVVEELTVNAAEGDAVLESLRRTLPDANSFDAAHLNSAISNSLSNEFNYIGFACGFIVFIFLWLSFGRIELTLAAFLPMAVGWIWILGIMQILGIQFNIVNVILATFIFGQGDDYSIFITEGLIYEYTYRKRVLASYKSSIIISALIMFIGIGALITARHPALRSLAEVTVVGMITVVAMAYLLPPVVFSWLTKKGGRARRMPVTAGAMLRTGYSAAVYLLQVLYGVILGFFLFVLMPKSESRRLFFHRVMYRFFRFDIRRIPGVEFEIRNPHNETFERPAIVICNHQSILDPLCFMMLTPKILVGTAGHVWHNPIIHRVLKFADFFTVEDGVESILDMCRERMAHGYNIALFPEGERSRDGRILRFHNGSFYLAEQLGVDIIPLYIHGLGDAMPKSSGLCYRGKITIEIGERISISDTALGATYQERTKAMRHIYEAHYEEMCRKIETAHYYRHLVAYKYAYKGIDVERAVRRRLRENDCYSAIVDGYDGPKQVVIENCGYGEAALLFALVHPDVEVTAIETDDEKLPVGKYCPHLPTNLSFLSSLEFTATDYPTARIITL